MEGAVWIEAVRTHGGGTLSLLSLRHLHSRTNKINKPRPPTTPPTIAPISFPLMVLLVVPALASAIAPALELALELEMDLEAEAEVAEDDAEEDDAAREDEEAAEDDEGTRDEEAFEEEAADVLAIAVDVLVGVRVRVSTKGFPLAFPRVDVLVFNPPLLVVCVVACCAC